MHVKKYFLPAVAVLLTGLAYRGYGWGGVALCLGLMVMWVLLHFTRMMQVLRRAAGRPVGFVGSAVMLNARLHAGMKLLQVVAMTKALGERLSAEGDQPELFRWTDASQSSVQCTFSGGKLSGWALSRPDEVKVTP